MDPVNVANQVVAGVLTGLVYGLMALGLSVIFGVVRVVNFAHGEMMTIAMYAATVLFAAFQLDPFLAVLPAAAAFFVFGYALQAGLINPFITRPEHSQFMLLVAVAIILVNALLMIFGPDARNVRSTTSSSRSRSAAFSSTRRACMPRFWPWPPQPRCSPFSGSR
jgi:branched-chain amino acid transport system permease protein